jgi:hypothetical protein
MGGYKRTSVEVEEFVREWSGKTRETWKTSKELASIIGVPMGTIQSIRNRFGISCCLDAKCKNCGKTFLITKLFTKFCSEKCRLEFEGKISNKNNKKAKWNAYMRNYKATHRPQIAKINNTYYHKRMNEFAELRAFKDGVLASSGRGIEKRGLIEADMKK